MSNKQTFDLDNQPGIRKTPIGRGDLRKINEILGLDFSRVVSMDITGDRVKVTALLANTDGLVALGGGDNGGYLKHTYEIPVVEDGEAMSPSEYYGREEV